ncbi:hypothetical protein NQD34_008059 [Periophthalmus magnuspinnatus]|nr:hypothetical protein NQD34_008059 [Periophthalmus magnuspinnatus]
MRMRRKGGRRQSSSVSAKTSSTSSWMKAMKSCRATWAFTVQDPYMHFVSMLPLKDCRYALYDATYETKETKKEDLVFIFWAPECASLKSKMIYASSKDAIKRKFEGIKHEWQVNGLEDLKDRRTLAEKLGAGSIVSFEGCPL